MELAVVDIKGKETGAKVKLPMAVFGIEPNDHAVYLDVKQYLANQRQGTHKSKERAEIAGSTKKLRKQKGSGAARVGSIKSPTFKGGGRVFGPRPRNYGFKLNKKVKAIARNSAMTYKAIDKDIIVLDSFNMDLPKTKEYKALLENLKLDNASTLLVTAENSPMIVLSGRNIPKTNVISATDLNTYQVLRADKLILTADSIKVIEEKLK
ncbi:MAG: large subunit ribosomal protein L4 [Sphingobacteriales bacterium]|jgi:large subunit ribosomal protein L4